MKNDIVTIPIFPKGGGWVHVGFTKDEIKFLINELESDLSDQFEDEIDPLVGVCLNKLEAGLKLFD